jgi:phospholipid/cholesterol/gamma-HCH transport system permease protein
MLLTGRVLRCWVTPPFSWWRDAFEQTFLVLKRCLIPASISVFVFGWGPVGVQGAVFLKLLGQLDRLGLGYSTASLREYVPWVTGMVVAGVGGTAITADLGARKVREELDALAVMGVDSMRTLVAPRVLALTIALPLLNLVGLIFAAGAGVVVELSNHAALSGYFASFTAGFTATDVYANLIKTVSFGFIIACVCAYKGLNAKGGSEGVGRAVNDAVVIAFASVWIFNFAFNAVYLAAFPGAAAVR